MNTFTRNLKRAMRANGMSLRGLAHKSGSALSYIHRVVQGKTDPTISKGEAIANALNTRLSTLLDEEKKGNNPS